MNSQRIALIVLFLIGILFIIGVNLGASHTDDTHVQTPSWLSGLGGALTKPQPLKLADLSSERASCLQQGKFVISVGSACVYAIAQSQFTQRAASLQLVQGTSATVILAQENVLPVQQSLTGAGATTTSNLIVYSSKAHGTLTIQCLNAGGAPTCLLALK
jgi:hypothetical protein